MHRNAREAVENWRDQVQAQSTSSTIYIKPVDHVCACKNCDPSLAPDGPRRRTLPHYAIRFEDASDALPLDSFGIALVNDEIVYGTYEILEGPQGKVWRFRGVPGSSDSPRHICATCIEREIRGGGIQITEDGHMNRLFYQNEAGETVPVTPEGQRPQACAEIVEGNVKVAWRRADRVLYDELMARSV
jgi:hypothetical protein